MTVPHSVMTDVDFERDGTQFSSLRIAQPLNDSAFHQVSIPIAVIKNGSGPSVLLIGGVHGDEPEGSLTLLNLLRRIRAEDIEGRLIVIPALNLPAVHKGQRVSPIDGRDLNRSFPGDPRGTLTSVIAHYVDAVLIPICDFILDGHSGGRSMLFLPCLWISAPSDKSLLKRTMDAAAAFAPPITLVSPEFGAGAMSESAERQGKTYMSTEVGGGGMVSPAALTIVETGLVRLLVHLGLLKQGAGSDPAPAGKGTRFMHLLGEHHNVISPDHGIFEPRAELGAGVSIGSVLGRMHSPDALGSMPLDIISQRSGTLVGVRAPASSRPGDLLAVIASDYPDA